MKLLQQNPPVLKWGCWLMQAVLYNVSKMVVVLVEVKNYYYIRLTAFFPGQPGLAGTRKENHYWNKR